jgi:hypothetical protein
LCWLYFQQSEEGTFILRFSTSMLGAISVSWNSIDEHGDAQVRPYKAWNFVLQSC